VCSLWGRQRLYRLKISLNLLLKQYDSDTIAQASAAVASKVAGPLRMRCVKAEAINVFVNEEEYGLWSL
jgi:hypothetical protein